MFGLGATELVIILVIILVLFGPTQLPKIGKMLGQTTKSIRDGLESPAEDEEKKAKPKPKKPAPVADDEEEDEEEPEATPKRAVDDNDKLEDEA